MIIDFSTQHLPTPKTEFEKQVLSYLTTWFDDSATVKVQTSGSTGTPKVFDVEKKRMRHSAKKTNDILGLKNGDSAMLCLPVDYISGKMMVVRAIERNLKLVVKTPSINPLIDLNEKITFCAMSPLQVENALDKIHLIKIIIIGGAAVSATLKNKIRKQLNSQIEPTRLYETYGMSETLSHIALKEIYPTQVKYFSVLDDIEISIDERGCLQIFAPKLNPELIITNDLVEVKNRKSFKFLGRIDHVINSAGLKIYPEQLESLVKQEIDNELVFLGIADEVLGQKLVLLIEGEENESITKRLDHISYPTKNHQPKEIIFIKNFPRIPNGKVNRKELLHLL